MTEGVMGERAGDEKKSLHRIGMIGGIVVVAVGSAVFWLAGGRYTGTDNAYVRAAKLMVTTDVSGIVQSVDIRQGQSVKKGQTLFRLDPEPFQINVDNNLAAFEQIALDLDSLKASYKSHLGAIESQQAAVRLAEITYRRYRVLAAKEALSAEKLDDARESFNSAQATLGTLKQQADAELAKLKGNPDLALEQYPAYRKARASLAEAERQLAHTVVRAPFDATVSEVDALQPGMLIVSSVSSFSTTSAVGLVSPSDLWISADMKETDLTYVREGDPVEITVDTYPGHTWHGTVAAVNQASDSAFSILPAQSSSANWVKIVQRIPVRIKVDRQVGDPPLRAGMSAVVSIDTHHRRWWRLLHG